MKSYNEMAKSALARIHEENQALARKRKVIIRTLVPTVSLCLAVIMGFSIAPFLEKKSMPEAEEYIEYEYTDSAVDADGTNQKFTENEPEAAAGGLARPENLGGTTPSSAPHDSGETTDDFCIRIVDISVRGKTYVEIESDNVFKYKEDEYLGNTTDFEGYYKNKKIKGEVYTAKGHSDFLIILFENDERLILKEVKGE